MFDVVYANLLNPQEAVYAILVAVGLIGLGLLALIGCTICFFPRPRPNKEIQLINALAEGTNNVCVWCNEKDKRVMNIHIVTLNRFAMRPREETFWVHPEHEQSLRSFIDYYTQYAKLFMLVIILFIAVSLATALLLKQFVLGIILPLGGIIIIVFPFVTPETVEMLGVQKSVKLARGLGVLLIGLGMLIEVLMLLAAR